MTRLLPPAEPNEAQLAQFEAYWEEARDYMLDMHRDSYGDMDATEEEVKKRWLAWQTAFWRRENCPADFFGVAETEPMQEVRTEMDLDALRDGLMDDMADAYEPLSRPPIWWRE